MTIDATLPGGLGSFGFDDEGVPAQRVEVVKDGIFVGYLTSRETAARLGQQRLDLQHARHGALGTRPRSRAQ